MEQIKLSKEDIDFLKAEYPELEHDEPSNAVSGNLLFCRSYNDKKICGKYSVEFKLEHGGNSILPKVRETKGKILSIAKRRKLTSIADVHLNNKNGELCIILPIKEKEYYPNGFELKRFLNHLEEHFYWITYFDRYNEKPWDDEPHDIVKAYINATRGNKNYRKDLKVAIENKERKRLSRPEFRRILKNNNLL